MKKRRFHIDGTYYNIPETEVDSFLSDNPHAEEVRKYDIEGKAYNIPLQHIDEFETDMGLKKKEDGINGYSNGLSKPSEVFSFDQYTEPAPKTIRLAGNRVEEHGRKKSLQPLATNEIRVPDAGQGTTEEIDPKHIQPLSIQEASNADKNILGNIWNHFTAGIGKLSAGAADLTAQLLVKLTPNEDWESDESRLKKLREEVVEPTRTATTELVGANVTPEQKAAFDKGFITRATGGLAEMLPALGGKGSGMILQGYDSGIESINSTPEGRELPESTKTIFGATVGTTVGLMNMLALDKIFGKQTSKIASDIATNTLVDLVKTEGKGITAEIAEKAILANLKTLKSQVLNGSIRVGRGALIGGGVGAAQEGANLLAETILNKSHGKEIFEEGSWKENLSRLGEATAVGGIGGSILGGISIPFSKTRTYISEKVANAKSPQDIIALKEELRNSAEGGQLSVEEAQHIDAIVDDYVRVNGKVPLEIPNRKEVVEKIMEREDVEKEIDKKTDELQTVDKAFQPERQQEITVLQNKAEEINQGILNPIQNEQATEAQTKKEATPQTTEEKIVEPSVSIENKNVAEQQIENQLANGKSKNPLADEELKKEFAAANLEDAKNAVSKRISGDKLLDTHDMMDEISGTNAEINDDGTITVYHRTTSENKKAIEEGGKMKGLEDGIFFSTKETGQAEGYGNAIIKLKIPAEKLELDDVFGNEAHLRLPTKKANEKVDVSKYLSQKKPKAEEKATVGNEVVEKKENEPPNLPPVEDVAIHAENPAFVLKKSELVRARNRVGIDDFVDENKTTHLKSATEAQRTIDKWKKDGVYDDKIADIQERAKVGRINNEEQFIFAKHLADLDATVNAIKDIKSPEYDEALKQYSAALEAADAARSEFGRQLGMVAINKGEPITLADWMAERKQSLDVDALSEKQKEETKVMFDAYEAKLKTAEEKQTKADEEISKLKAELDFKTQLEQRKTIRKKNREQLSQERDDIIASIREKLGKSKSELSATAIPYAKQLISIAPDVNKLVRNLVDTGISKLADVVDTIHEVLSPEIDGLTKKDVNDLIAGVYSERKPTLSEVQLQLKKLRQEAKNTSAEFQLSDKKKRVEEETKKIEEKIKNRDYAPTRKLGIGENEMLRKANPKLWKETMDAIIAKNEAQDKLELAKRRDEFARRPWYKKVIKTGGKVLTTAKAIKAGIDDSVTGVQLLWAIYSNPKAGIKAKIEAIKDINNTRFKRQLAALHNSPMWNTIKESGLDITEPKSLSKENLEELYSGNLLDTKIGGKVNLWTYTGGIFERLFTSMGNNLRLNLFKSRVNELISKGMTFESHPQEYKDAARVINELTARGKVAKEVQGAMGAVSPIIWAPKMISSSLNMLGISDLTMGLKGRGYYQNLTPEARAFAVRQLINGVGTGVAIMAAFAARGWTIDKDPQSVGFGSITSPDGNRRYNIFGRFSSTAKTFVQMVTGTKKTGEGVEVDLDAREGRGVTLWKYTRGKMTPFAGEVGDYFLNRKRNMFTGKPISLSTLPNDLITPISANDIKQGWSNDGYEAIFNRMIPAIEGLQVQDKRDFKDKDLPSLIERNKRSSDQDTHNYINYKTNKPITKDERNNYVEKRDSAIEDELTKLFNGTSSQNIVIENGKVITKPYSEMSRDQIIDATTAIKRHATETIKKELFGEKEETDDKKDLEKEKKELREEKEGVKSDW